MTATLHYRRALVRRIGRLVGLLALVAPLAGCAGYHVGPQGLYPPDIHTVYVPMIESDSFRRDLGEMLTEAVCKEIESRTPFKVVGTPNADSVLVARVSGDTKHGIVRDPYNESREIEIAMTLKVSWADRRGNVIREGTVSLGPDAADLTSTAKLIPEYGGSTVVTQQQVMTRLAKQVVNLMETPW